MGDPYNWCVCSVFEWVAWGTYECWIFSTFCGSLLCWPTGACCCCWLGGAMGQLTGQFGSSKDKLAMPESASSPRGGERFVVLWGWTCFGSFFRGFWFIRNLAEFWSVVVVVGSGADVFPRSECSEVCRIKFGRSASLLIGSLILRSDSMLRSFIFCWLGSGRWRQPLHIHTVPLLFASFFT